VGEQLRHFLQARQFGAKNHLVGKPFVAHGASRHAIHRGTQRLLHTAHQFFGCLHNSNEISGAKIEKKVRPKAKFGI